MDTTKLLAAARRGAWTLCEKCRLAFLRLREEAGPMEGEICWDCLHPEMQKTSGLEVQ